MSKELKPHIIQVFTTQIGEIYINAPDTRTAEILARDYWREQYGNKEMVAGHHIISIDSYVKDVTMN